MRTCLDMMTPFGHTGAYRQGKSVHMLCLASILLRVLNFDYLRYDLSAFLPEKDKNCHSRPSLYELQPGLAGDG